MFCIDCGKERLENAKFCQGCGKGIVDFIILYIHTYFQVICFIKCTVGYFAYNSISQIWPKISKSSMLQIIKYMCEGEI